MIKTMSRCHLMSQRLTSSSRNRTPWSGSLVSDRLKPSRPSSPNKQQQNTKGKGKEKEKENDKPKSEKVKELEGYIAALSGSPPKSSKRLVCFCQGIYHPAVHSTNTNTPLSTYTPTLDIFSHLHFMRSHPLHTQPLSTSLLPFNRPLSTLHLFTLPNPSISRRTPRETRSRTG